MIDKPETVCVVVPPQSPPLLLTCSPTPSLSQSRACDAYGLPANDDGWATLHRRGFRCFEATLTVNPKRMLD